MKKYLVFATIILLFISCTSCKSKNDSTDNTKKNNEVLPKDSLNELEKLKQTNLNQIGDISLGMKAATIKEKLGQPVSTSAAEIWDADGWYHQDWLYPTKGIMLNMSGENDSTRLDVFSITITSPSLYKTNKDIGIGSIYSRVMTVYEKDIDPSSSDENVVTVGSLYGGIIFEFADKKVVKIFLGAAAE